MNNKFPLEDCCYCHFLGYWNGHDLYFHHGNAETTLIARYGNEGDYYSGIVFAVIEKPNKALYQALIRALKVDEYKDIIIKYFEKHHREIPERLEMLHKIIRRIEKMDKFKGMPKEEAINYCYRHREEFVAMYVDANEGNKSFDSLIVRIEEGDVSPWELPQYRMDF